MHASEQMLMRIGVHLSRGLDCREAVALEGGEEQVEAAFMNAPKAGPTQPEVAGRLLAVLAVVGRMNQDDEDMEQALELTAAGWTVITPEARATPPKNIWQTTAVMSWKWRRPAKDPGRPGRKFASTNQAWRAMKRERGEL